MSLQPLLRDPVLAELLEKEIDLRARKAAWRFNIPADVLFQIYAQTVVLDESGEPRHIQLERIKHSGFTDDDIYFEPSIDEAFEILEKDVVVSLFTEGFGELKRRYETNKILYQAVPPILTYTEWGQILRRYIEFLKSEQESLSSLGYSRNIPEVPFLLRCAPKGFLINFNEMELCAQEIKGKTFDEIKGLMKPMGKNSDLADLAPIYRKILVPLYSDALNLIYDQDIKDSSQLARQLANLIFKYLPNVDDIFSIKEIEEYELKTFDARMDDEIDYLEEIDPSILDNEYSLPLILQGLMDFVSLSYNEIQTHRMTKVRGTSAMQTTKTALSYALFNVVFDFTLWQKNADEREITFKILDEISAALEDVEKNTTNFIRECVARLRNFYFVPVTATPALQAPNKELIPQEKVEPDKDSELSQGRHEKEYRIEGSEFVFSQNFQVLKWRERIWKFKEWECEIIKEFYQANKRNDSVTSDSIDDLAYEAHYKDNARATSRTKSDKKKKGYTYLGKNKEVRPKYYLWKHVLQSNQDLRQTFIVSDEVNPGKYKLDPNWNPEEGKKQIVTKRSLKKSQ